MNVKPSTIIAALLLIGCCGIRASGATFNVREYGAVGDGIASDAGAIQKTIDAAIAAGPGNTVLLPAGRYLLPKGLVVDKAQGLTFTGAPGAPPLLLTTPENGFVLSVLHSDHVTINNVANDGQVLNFTQGTITALQATPPAITVRLDPGYPAPDAPQLVTARLLTTFSDPSRAAYDPHHPAILSKIKISSGLWTLTLDSPPVDGFIGEKIAVWNRDHNPPGLLYNIGYDSNTTLSNVRDYCGGWTSAGNIYGYTGENFLTNFYEGPPPGSNRLITSGGGMVGGGRGNLTLTGCDFSQIDDDCVDLGGGFDHLISQEQPNVITTSFGGAQIGDTIQVWSWKIGDPYVRDAAKVTKVDSVDTPHGRFARLTLDSPVTVLRPDPTNSSGGNDGYDAFRDVSATGALTFRHCRFQSDRARGMLLHPSGPVTIDHCVVHGCRWLGIFIGIEQEDYEGAVPSRIRVTNSKFYGNDGISCFIGFDNGYQVGTETHTVFPDVTVSGNSFVDTDLPNAAIGPNPGQYDWPAPLLVMGAEAATISQQLLPQRLGAEHFPAIGQQRACSQQYVCPAEPNPGLAGEGNAYRLCHRRGPRPGNHLGGKCRGAAGAVHVGAVSPDADRDRRHRRSHRHQACSCHDAGASRGPQAAASPPGACGPGS